MKVLALVDRSTGRSRAQVVDHLSMKDVYPILKANIAREARIMTDEAPMYRGLSKILPTIRLSITEPASMAVVKLAPIRLKVTSLFSSAA